MSSDPWHCTPCIASNVCVCKPSSQDHQVLHNNRGVGFLVLNIFIGSCGRTTMGTHMVSVVSTAIQSPSFLKPRHIISGISRMLITCRSEVLNLNELAGWIWTVGFSLQLAEPVCQYVRLMLPPLTALS